MNRNQLKILACISMVVDHIGYVMLPDIAALRIIGRIAMPVFGFFIVLVLFGVFVAAFSTLVFLVVLRGYVVRHREGKINLRVDGANLVHKVVFPFLLQGEYGKILSAIDGQLVGGAVVRHRGYGCQRQAALDKPETGDKLGIRNNIFRLNQHRNDNDGAKQRNQNQEGALQSVGNFFNSVHDNSVDRKPDANGTQNKCQNAKYNAQRRMFEGEYFPVVFYLFVFHSCIITRFLEKSNKSFLKNL